MKDKLAKIEIEVDRDKIYKVTTSVSEQELTDLFIENRNMARAPSMYAFEVRLTELFAEEYLKRNYDKMAGLIDMDTVKLLATRKLAKIVSSNTGND